jgi:heme exporter protein D
MLEAFAGASWGEFFAHFGWAGVHAFTAWLVTAPLLMAALYLPLVPVFTRTAGRLRRASALPVGA